MKRNFQRFPLTRVEIAISKTIIGIYALDYFKNLNFTFYDFFKIAYNIILNLTLLYYFTKT